MIPTREQNPDGLHGRYITTKTDGSPVDPDAVYFTLRVDPNGSDPVHIEACQWALLMYSIMARRGSSRFDAMSTDIWDLLERLDPHASERHAQLAGAAEDLPMHTAE